MCSMVSFAKVNSFYESTNILINESKKMIFRKYLKNFTSRLSGSHILRYFLTDTNKHKSWTCKWETKQWVVYICI